MTLEYKPPPEKVESPFEAMTDADAPRTPTLTMTPQRRRTVARWFILGANAIPFALFAVLYPTLNIDGNDARLLVGGWALVVVVHLFITALLDMREGYLQARDERRQRRQIEIQQKRLRMMQRFRVGEEDGA